MAADLRRRRLESLLAELISEIIARGRIRDPRLGQCLMAVTEVKVAKDLRDAKVSISVVDRSTGNEAEDPLARDARSEAIDGLNHAAGYIQRLVAEHLTLRAMPRLRFVLDTSIESGFNLVRKLDEIAGAPARPEGSQGGAAQSSDGTDRPAGGQSRPGNGRAD